MSKINWGRLFIGALVAAIMCFFTDGFLHERIVKADWTAAFDTMGVVVDSSHKTYALVYFFIAELGRGFLMIFLYALMRPQFNPGPKTAVLAGIITWLAFSVTFPAQFIPLGFYSNALWVKVGAFQLLTSILAAIAGAAIYKDRT